MLGNVAWMSRKRVEATVPTCQVSLTLDVIKCIVSVAHLPALPPNCVGGNSSCFSVRKEMSAVTRVEKSFPMVSKRPMG